MPANFNGTRITQRNTVFLQKLVDVSLFQRSIFTISLERQPTLSDVYLRCLLAVKSLHPGLLPVRAKSKEIKRPDLMPVQAKEQKELKGNPAAKAPRSNSFFNLSFCTRVSPLALFRRSARKPFCASCCAQSLTVARLPPNSLAISAC